MTDSRTLEKVTKVKNKRTNNGKKMKNVHKHLKGENIYLAKK